jgi:RNA polymerase sigma factor (sigma-70 family)
MWNRMGGWSNRMGVTGSAGNAGELPEGTALSFDEMYRREYRRTWQLAWLLTHDEQLAEDITQEAFLSALSRFASLDTPEGYVRRSVVNLARGEYRKRLRRQRTRHLLSTSAPPADIPELSDVVARLPYRQRVVVVGRYWAGWSEAELANTLGCRPGTVKSLASRALDTIRREIGTPHEP